MSNDQTHPHTIWLSIAKYAVAVIIGVIGAAFTIGGRAQKIHDLETWKTETAPIIKRMDTSGTLSFELFHKEYERTQTRHEKKLEELEKEVKELDKKLDP